MIFCMRSGISPVHMVLSASEARTRLRETKVEPNRSSPSCCEASESSVSVTWRDFFEKKSVRTITAPDSNSSRKLARAGLASSPIMIDSLPVSRAICHAS